ncbi:tRNA methyltransferase complex GCD14 subunit [Ascodesmis nigricans]|uniref:tRNA (adenine(58)-N(1))-methyltransferase catalytic subunit TRM61 n=1 Tax=Ascodesmis nigricans TaxID=341454 RepID=A0A4S2N878_9PEZI|nr:tRNA methyltransferase complex GCD14 subunit [Ascodesmis nigricans]
MSAPTVDKKAPSPFLVTPSTITPGAPCPSIIHLKRDHHLALAVKSTPTEGPPPILQTRFGEFPHASFAGIPYGSQVRARTTPKTANAGRKRKRAAVAADSSSSPSTPAAESGGDKAEEAGAAGSGFVHVLAPTAELWTASLPHRTQVVYTPDSSYILHQLGVRPGSVIIEAGAGSGSFTHAAVRAAYSGYPDGRELEEGEKPRASRFGKVWSFEFHEERAGKLKEEIAAHGLDGLVQITHQDVCKNGFLVPGEEPVSPKANAVFLDLPAPWLAVPHLTRSAPPSTDPTTPISFISPLDPNTATRICCFSPCMEQVTRTVASLRAHGWTSITMLELQHRRLEVRRQQARGYSEGASARTLSEALSRLVTVNALRDARRDDQLAQNKQEKASGKLAQLLDENKETYHSKQGPRKETDPDEGRLVTRNEAELKTHTSYLTFATLPRAWSKEDEEAAMREVQKISEGVVKGTVGDKEKRWKKEKVEGEPESNRAKKKREREERKKLESQGENGSKNGETKQADAEGMEIDG